MSGTRTAVADAAVYPALASGVEVLAAVAGKTYIGTSPDCAVVVRGPQTSLRFWLDGIDGRLGVPALLDQAERLGLRRTHAAVLLDELLSTGLAIESTTAAGTRPAQRSGAVVVIGARAVADRLVDLASESTTLRRRVDSFRSTRLLRVGSGRTGVGDGRAIAAGQELADAMLAVLVLDRVAADLEEIAFADDLAGRGLPHLVVAATTVSRVGPLVLPGVTACLRCEDLGLAGRDQDWRELALSWSLEEPARPANPILELTCAETVRRLEGIIDRGVGQLDESDREVGLLAVAQTRSGGGAWEHHHPVRHPECGCSWQGQPVVRPSSPR